MTPTTVVKTPLSSDGTHIYAEAVGNPRNPHIVFIHEATLCSIVFDQLFQDSRLTDHLLLVRYDLRCHGRSGTTRGTESHRAALYTDDFRAVAGAFGLQRPILVAWGFGAAAVADIFAHVSPLTVAGIVYIAPLPFLGPMISRTVTPSMLGVMQALGATSNAAALGRVKTDFVNAILAGPARRPADAIKTAWLGRSISQEPEVTNDVFCRRHDPTKLLEAGGRGLPLMILVGSEDALVDNSAIVLELRRYFRHAEAYVVGGSSHALFLDRQDEFVKHLLMFVGRLAVMTLMN